MISGHSISTGFHGLIGYQQDPWDLGRHCTSLSGCTRMVYFHPYFEFSFLFIILKHNLNLIDN